MSSHSDERIDWVVRDNDAGGFRGGISPRALLTQRRILIGAAVVLLLALFARVMSEALRHDEQIYLPIASLFGRYALYQDMSYAHLPNLPILLHGFLFATGGEYQFLAARFVVFLCWVGLLYAFTSVAWRLSRSIAATVLAVLLIVTNTLFVDYAGMIVAAHLFPICFAVFAFLFFLIAMESDRVRPGYVFLCGLFLAIAAGFKANYVIVIPPFAVAAFLVPRSLPFKRRLVAVVLPMVLGGIIGGLPSIYYLATHTNAFVFDVLDYFLGPHPAYWNEPANAVEAKGLSLPARVIYGYRLWSTGSALLIAVTGIYCVAFALASPEPRAQLRRMTSWPMLLCLALTILGILVAFVPKPSFPQYFMPPIPFAILLLMCLIGAQTDEQRSRSRPILIAVGIASLVAGGPALFADLPRLAKPASWEGMRIHRTAARIHEALDFSGGKPRVATLAPIYAIEAGADVYPELASGPFYYRIGDYLSADQRRSYRITSPRTIGELLGRQPPDAVLVGHEGVLDEPLERFALAHGYRRVDRSIGHDRYGETRLYVRPSPRGD